MAPDVELVINLQNLDRQILELKTEISTLPKHIAEIEKALVSHQRKLEADEAALVANQKERKKLEGDIRILEEKISKLNDQMLLAKTNEQYTAFKHEIGFCETEIRKHEDRILDLMAESEPLEENVKKAHTALKVEQLEVNKEKKSVRQRTAADEKTLDECRAERRKIAETVSPKALAQYDRLRKRYGGVVLTEVINGRCSSCNIAMRPQYFQDLKQATEPLVCENCGRMVYYHAVIDVEAENAPQ